MAHEAGWLTRSNELIQLSQLLLQADVPVKAAKILQAALDGGSVESNERNWRLLAQSWQLSQEDERAVPALTRAAGLAEDGTLDVSLAQSYQNLYAWKTVSMRHARYPQGRSAPRGPGVHDSRLLSVRAQGIQRRRNAFEEAAEDERSRTNARSWIQYVNSEERRDRELAAALAR